MESPPKVHPYEVEKMGQLSIFWKRLRMVIVFSTNTWLEKIEKTMDYARSQKYPFPCERMDRTSN